jgi:hypothetical protein
VSGGPHGKAPTTLVWKGGRHAHEGALGGGHGGQVWKRFISREDAEELKRKRSPWVLKHCDIALDMDKLDAFINSTTVQDKLRPPDAEETLVSEA